MLKTKLKTAKKKITSKLKKKNRTKRTSLGSVEKSLNSNRVKKYDPIDVLYLEDADEHIIKQLEKTLLEDDLAELTVVRTAQEFIEMFITNKAKEYDVLLLDRYVNGLDTIAFLPHITKTYPRTRIIMVTSFSDLVSIQKARKMGAHAWVCKPSEYIKRFCEELRTRIIDENELKKQQENVFIGSDVPTCKTLQEVERALFFLEAQILIKWAKQFKTFDEAAANAKITKRNLIYKLEKFGIKFSMLTGRGKFAGIPVEQVMEAMWKRNARAAADRIQRLGYVEKFNEKKESPKPKKKVDKQKKQDSKGQNIAPAKPHASLASKTHQLELPLTASATVRQASPAPATHRPRIVIRRRAHEIEAEKQAHS